MRYTKDDIEDRVKQYLIDRVGIDDKDSLDKLSTTNNIRLEYGLDSLDTVEFIMDMERDFDINIHDDLLSKTCIISLDEVKNIISGLIQ